MRRRNFLQNILRGSVLLGVAALLYGVTPLLAPRRATARRNILRPPGALRDAARFIAACIGCGVCGEVCPPRCINFYSDDGGVKANTPYIDAGEKACILCDKCMEVCPTEALTVMPRGEIDMGLAEIDRTACYPWVDRGICGACVSVCPLGDKAIAYQMWNQYRPVIREGCVGCGLCVEVCPHPSVPVWVNAAA